MVSSLVERLEFNKNIRSEFRGFRRRIRLEFALENESASGVDLLTQWHSYFQAVGH